MKILESINNVGSRCCKATGWRFEPAYNYAKFTDGTTRYLGRDALLDTHLNQLKQEGVNTEAFELNLRIWREADEKATTVPPDIIEATHYQNDRYGYDKPEVLGEWSWSTTFGRWGRCVKFKADQGWIFTFPERVDCTKRRLESQDVSLLKVYSVYDGRKSYETPVGEVKAYTEEEAKSAAIRTFKCDADDVLMWYEKPVI